MYERFTDRARKAMQLANQEAQRANHGYIAPEHVLLGILKEGNGVAVKVLANLGVDPLKMHIALRDSLTSGPDMVTMGKLPQTPGARRVVESAVNEARGLGHSHVGTEHLLLGILLEAIRNSCDSPLARFLDDASVHHAPAREQVAKMVPPSPEPATPHAWMSTNRAERTDEHPHISSVHVAIAPNRAAMSMEARGMDAADLWRELATSAVRAALDAAVLKERERCLAVVREEMEAAKGRNETAVACALLKAARAIEEKE